MAGIYRVRPDVRDATAGRGKEKNHEWRRISGSDSRYKHFGVKIGQEVTLVLENGNRQQFERVRARVAEFHPRMYWVRVQYLRSGQSECYSPTAFCEALIQ